MSPVPLLLLPLLLAYALDPLWPVPSELWQPQVALPSTDIYVYINSTSSNGGCPTGDFLYTPANAALTVHTRKGGKLDISVNGDESWTNVFETAQSSIMRGYYDHANGMPGDMSTSRGLLVSENVINCIVIGGWLAVDRVEYQDGVMTALEMRFEAYSDGANRVNGAVHWSSRTQLHASGPAPIPQDLWSPPPQIIPANTNFAYISLPTANQHYTYTSPQALILVTTSFNPICVQVIGEEHWSGSFYAAKSLSRLEAGYYGELVMRHHANPVRARMAWGLGAECKRGSGWFAIDTIEYDGANQINKIEMRFGHICEGAQEPIYGAINWQYSNPVNPSVPLFPPPANLWAPQVPLEGNSFYIETVRNVHGKAAANSANWTNSLFNAQEIDGELIVSINGNEWWKGTFRDADSQRIERVGYYGIYRHYMESDRRYSGFKWEGLTLIECKTYTGWYMIDGIAYSDGVLSLLQLRFEMLCNSPSFPIHGALSWSLSNPQYESKPAIPPLGLWSPANLSKYENILYLESKDEEILGEIGHVICAIGSQTTVSTVQSTLAIQITCKGNIWQGMFTPMASLSQLEAGYYGDIEVFSAYSSPLKGTFRFSPLNCDRTGWFAVDSISYSQGVIASVAIRFEENCPNRPALKGYFNWNFTSLWTPKGFSCTEMQSLWQPMECFLPQADSYLYIENNGQTLQAIYTTDLAVSLVNSTIIVEVSLSTGLVKGSFQPGSLAPGCYDGGVCWGENCEKGEGWLVVEKLEGLGERLSGLEMRFEQRNEGLVQWRGALKWVNPV